MSVAVKAIVAAMTSVMQPDHGDHQQHLRREDREEPPDQIDARRDHRGGMNQGADRRGPFHRVGQPHVQRELGALAHAAAEDAEAGDHEQPIAARSPGACQRGNWATTWASAAAARSGVAA